MTITEWLKAKGLDEKPVPRQAKALGVSTVTLWRILNQKRDVSARSRGISVRTIETIVRKTGGDVGYEDLVGGASAQ